MDPSDIQSRLEEKRRRVAALREARQQRLQEKIREKPRDVDDLVSELLGVKKEEKVAEEREVVETPAPVPPKQLELSKPTAVITIAAETLEVYSKSIQTDTIVEEPLPETEKPVEPVTIEAIPVVEEEVISVPKPVFTEEDRNNVLRNPGFVSFVNHASRIMDRALAAGDEWDPFIDYSTIEENKNLTVEKKPLTLKTKFEHNQPVSQLSFSPRHSELLGVAYAGENNGSVLVWNTHATSKPEFSFGCQSGVLSVLFHPFKPNIVLGGSMSGQVMRWDMATSKEMPIQRSPLSATTHSGPVFAIVIVGVENAHSLVTADTNGRLCSWSPLSLVRPTESLDVLRPQGGQSRSVAVTCMAFERDEVNNFIVGAEDGGVYECHRKGSAGGSVVVSRLDSHTAPVCSIDYHPTTDGLILSAGMDWRVVISTADRVIHAIDFADSVYDAKWSPTHPAMFAVADGTGTLSLWNINKDVEEPIYKFSEGGHAFNSVRWSLNGKHVACGNSAGMVFYLDVHSSEENVSGVSGGAAEVFDWSGV